MSVCVCVVCRGYARGIGTAFEKRPDLRVIICNALATMCLQNRKALKVSVMSYTMSYTVFCMNMSTTVCTVVAYNDGLRL